MMWIFILDAIFFWLCGIIYWRQVAGIERKWYHYVIAIALLALGAVFVVGIFT